MEAQLRPASANETDQLAALAIDLPTVDSAELMNGARELRIRHGASTYRLRVTTSDKLILTK